MYGWFGVYYPLASRVNAHVYDDERSQVYKFGSAKTSTSNAVDYYSNRGMETSSGKLFLSEYRAGTYSKDGKASGTMYQYGTKYLADIGNNSAYIMRYYYDYSTRVGGTAIVFFTF